MVLNPLSPDVALTEPTPTDPILSSAIVVETGNGGDGGYHGNAGPVKGGDGGSASGGHINITGGDGNNGVDNDFVPSGNNYRSSYGNGGSSYWGGGGRGSAYNQGPQAGKAYGSGGGASGSPASSFNGGAGMNGVVFVEEFS